MMGIKELCTGGSPRPYCWAIQVRGIFDEKKYTRPKVLIIMDDRSMLVAGTLHQYVPKLKLHLEALEA